MRKDQVSRDTRQITNTHPQLPFIGIPGNGGDGSGGFLCFICGRSTDRGEPFTCVSRQVRRRQGNQRDSSVIKAMASLQVCLPCTLLSIQHQLSWIHKPKLLELEIRGFNTYARLLADRISQAKSDTPAQGQIAGSPLRDAPHYLIELDRAVLLGGTYQDNSYNVFSDDQCHGCYEPIDFSKPHILFELSIQIPKRKVMGVSNIWPLGSYCDQCLDELLPLCDRLW